MDCKFCPHCGASLATAPGAGFCPACGGALSGDGAPKRGKPFLRLGLAVLLGGALLAGLLWFFKALPTPLLASDSPWLCFTAESADATVGLEAVGNAPAVTLEISPDGRVWNDWGQPRVAYLHQPGDKLYVRAKNANRAFANPDGMNRGKSDYHRFTISGKVAASGNLMSLVDKEGKRLSLEGMDFAFAFLFEDCAGLTAAPRLPATKLAKACFLSMFKGCANLTTAPELPATELTQGCYAGMFVGCAALTAAPRLPATKLAEGCYAGMFFSCAGLTHAPELPATELADSCYTDMFKGCAALAAAPELPATKLTFDCYRAMFEDCAGLTRAPALPATELAQGCYASMFANCKGLTAAPELPATTLVAKCYKWMFAGCANLAAAPALPATTLAKNCYQEMFKNCAKLTAAPEIPAPATEQENSGIDTMFAGCGDVEATHAEACKKAEAARAEARKKATANAASPLCFIAESPSVTVELRAEGDAPKVVLEISTDGQRWRPWEAPRKVTLARKGDWLFVRAAATNATFAKGDNDYHHFQATGKIAASGNVMSLLDREGKLRSLAGRDSAFLKLFYDCQGLTSAPLLPATELAADCYGGMFNGCAELTSAPRLPAIKLENRCYLGMFMKCPQLTAAPELPATELAWNCYSLMFFDCTGLTTAPALPATKLTENCYAYMFANCANLTSVPALPATDLATDCYKEMFKNCTKLTTAPGIPVNATKRTYSGIDTMFEGCDGIKDKPKK